ncbi:MAG: hypothetical protein AB7Q37_16870 [Pyrinomonadaceae bacterium]
MKFGIDLVSPSYTRTPTYDSLNAQAQSYEFDCIRCSMRIVIDFTDILNNESQWPYDFDKVTENQIRLHFDMNMVGKSPDGGWPKIITRRCIGCSVKYMLYAGVNEVANSVYKITIQGITEIIDE